MLMNFGLLLKTSDGSRISPRWGVKPSGGGGGGGQGHEHTILPNSPKNCMKLKEFGCPVEGGGRAFLTPPAN